MELDDHQKRRVLDWVIARANGLGCVCCRLTDYKIEGQLYDLPGNAGNPAAGPITTVVLVCPRCGHVRLHAAATIGVTGVAAAAPGEPAPGPAPKAAPGPLPPP